MSGTSYHFRVVSTNGNGLTSSSADNTFATSTLISITITSPIDGATISRPDVMVEGTVTHTTGNETGVTVNGVLAIVHGGRFVANHVPLLEGENTLTVKAADTEGNFYNVSTIVYGDTGADYIRISATPESGLSPLEAALRLEGSIAISTSSVSYAGPGTVEFPTGSVEEYTAQMTAEGIYYFTAEATDAENNIYTDTVAVQVLDIAELDALLKSKWSGLKLELMNGDIEGGMEYFSESSKQRYSEIFNYIEENIPGGISDEAQSLPEPILVEGDGSLVTYILAREEDGTMMEYTLYFVKDNFGLWKIYEY